MGAFLNLLLFFFAIYFLWKIIKQFIIGNHRRAANNPYNKKEEKQPETQEERILEYQKKSFEKTDAEDVDFEEIKDAEPKN